MWNGQGGYPSSRSVDHDDTTNNNNTNPHLHSASLDAITALTSISAAVAANHHHGGFLPPAPPPNNGGTGYHHPAALYHHHPATASPSAAVVGYGISATALNTTTNAAAVGGHSGTAADYAAGRDHGGAVGAVAAAASIEAAHSYLNRHAALYGGGGVVPTTTNGGYDDRTADGRIVARRSGSEDYPYRPAVHSSGSEDYPYRPAVHSSAALAAAGVTPSYAGATYGSAATIGPPDDNHHFSDGDEEGDDDDGEDDDDVNDDQEIPTPRSAVPVVVVQPHERGKPMALQQAIVANGGGNNGSQVASPPPRGKPEAMARAMAMKASSDDEEDEDDDMEEQKEEIRPVKPAKPTPAPAATPAPTKKRATSASKKSSKTATTTTATTPPAKQNQRRLPKKKTTGNNHISNDDNNNQSTRTEFVLGDRNVPDLSEDEYLNLEELMKEFCKVPLLAEFRLPVAVLHPEISKTYNSIISQPVDLGHVCRGIRQRRYKNLRDVRLDLWLVFANCVKYNSHPNNKDAVPSFVSIALHLREFLNNLWQEFMLPSDLDVAGMTPALRDVTMAAFTARVRERKRRIESSGVLIVSRDYVSRITHSLAQFVQNGGRVDRLDATAVFSDETYSSSAELAEIMQRINAYNGKLQDYVLSEEGGDIQLEALYHDLKRTCFGEEMDVVSETRNWVFGRLDRWFWKIATPLHEANSRGVAQSSIWGNIAACIWARESGKKPYWPALCLGILPPADQRETWHDAVTERNESRLPEKLRAQLQTAKKRCEQAQKRQSLSYFLVEFLGTHEFIWVKESDIVEEFDPEQDPNKIVKHTGKKGRPSRANSGTAPDNKTYHNALQECLWANSEYENVLSDALKRDGDVEGADGGDDSFSVLAHVDGDRNYDLDDNVEYGFDDDAMSATDVDDLNFILVHNGLINPDVLTRKSGKRKKSVQKRASATKKEETTSAPTKATSISKSTTSKSPASKSPASKSKIKSKEQDEAATERVEKKDVKEAEKRRKKRTREREKVLRAEERKKRRRAGIEGIDLEDYELNFDKRARATIVANAYLMRLKSKDDNVKSFALSGVMGMPVASIDSIGLLGMTLAFRAASGMLRMPDEGVDDESKKRCPWKEISTAKVKSTTERAELLKKKLELMKKELERVERNSGQRLEWIEKSNSKHEAAMARVDSADKAARQNPYKIKKKATTATTPSPKPKSPQTIKSVPSSLDAASENSGDAEMPVSEVEAIATPDADGSSMHDDDESAVEVEAMVLDDD